MKFDEVLYHRMKYFLSPQLDLYGHVANRCRYQTILDYGCGWGFGLMQFDLRCQNVTGVDCDVHAIEFARRVIGGTGVKFEIADWTEGRAPGDDRRWHAVLCIEVIEHVDDPALLLSELRSRVMSGGCVIISTLNHNSQYRKNDCHVGRFTVGTFRTAVEKYFPDAQILDYQLSEELDDDSTVTPVVAFWQEGRVG